ncbi:hypothetical protein INT48_002314 [Thamnidium elegans]|uniref:Uncharacterized protein n=1 Tax=Thamnidium elegans TaxID=101142 RepID=A0A8H7STK9_9FUNG|nr:hypothetical protein INT48_002314 [Thamnidium elegans]
MYCNSSQDKEPAPSKWQSWAQEEDLHQKITGNLPSPKITHTKAHLPPSLPPVFDNKLAHRIQPNADQLDFLSFDPPQCFCKRTAHRSYTLEYGPILECSSYSSDKQDSYRTTFTCGFHVHELSWKQFKSDLKHGGTVHAEFSELRACPLYNFTFCTLFYLTNSFDKITPAVLPDCFCGYPVQLREKKLDGFCKLYFTCKNASVEGVKKCAWNLNAKEVAFTKPRHRLHKHVDVETYHRYQQEKKNVLHQSKAQHHSDLLATLSAKPTAHSLVVPTSVLAKKQPNLPLSSSSSTSTSSTLSSPTLQKPTSYELQEDTSLLEFSVLHFNRDAKLRIKELETTVTKFMDKLLKTESEFKDKVALLKCELEQESVLRLSGQERLSNIEAEVVALINEKERLAKEFQDYKEQIFEKYGKEEEYNKCKVCFSKPIEYVLTPCFHLGK